MEVGASTQRWARRPIHAQHPPFLAPRPVRRDPLDPVGALTVRIRSHNASNDPPRREAFRLKGEAHAATAIDFDRLPADCL